MGVDACLVHIFVFDVRLGGIAGAITIGKHIVGVGTGNIIGLAVQAEVDTTGVDKTGRGSLNSLWFLGKKSYSKRLDIYVLE